MRTALFKGVFVPGVWPWVHVDHPLALAMDTDRRAFFFSAHALQVCGLLAQVMVAYGVCFACGTLPSLRVRMALYLFSANCDLLPFNVLLGTNPALLLAPLPTLYVCTRSSLFFRRHGEQLKKAR